MFKLIVQRLMALVPLLFIVSVLTFSFTSLLPSDPVDLIIGDLGTQEQYDMVRERLGLNEPVVLRYVEWLGRAVQGDLGTSFFNSVSVTGAVMQRLPVTLSLTVVSALIAVVVGVGAGIAAALRPRSWIDRLATLGATIGQAIPNFWFGLIMVAVFAVNLRWFPATGFTPISASPWDWLRSVTLPALALGLSSSAAIARQVRSAMVGVLQQDYIRAARAQGLSARRVVFKHALTNAMVPVVSGKTLTGLAILGLMGGGVRTTHGSITLNGTELRSLPAGQIEKVRGNEVAMVFQDPATSLDPAFNVGSQIAEVLRAKKGLSRKEAWERVVELIHRVGIPRPEERARAYPHELSGGMAQRIAIARALSCNPSLLIADEPTTALDVTVQQEILDLFRDLQAEFGMAILFVTHDLAVAADICDRISVMYAGEIVETAQVGALFADPRHPYTRGLLSAMPHASDRNPPLPTIRGYVPRPGSWPAGCRFSNRCDFRIAA